MAGWKKRYWKRAVRRGRHYYYYGRRRRYRRSSRYINGSNRATIRLKCLQQDAQASRSSGYGPNYGSVYAIYPYTNMGNGLCANDLYKKYVDLYEETKFIGMKVQICITSVIGGADIPSLQIFTAWDRRHGVTEPARSAAEIVKSSTSSVLTALNNNVAKFTKSIWASDLIEKAQWHDCDLDSTGKDSAWADAGANPNFFCPCFYMVFGNPSKASATTVYFSVATTYYVAFRSPRYAIASTKDLPEKVFVSMDDDQEGELMANDTLMEDVPPAATAAADTAGLDKLEVKSGPRHGKLVAGLAAAGGTAAIGKMAYDTVRALNRIRDEL